MNNVDPKELGIPNINFSIPEISKRRKKYRNQRITRGFDDTETWSLDHTITDFILPRLKVFRKLTVGFPAHLNSIEEWHSIIDSMIIAFQKMRNENHWDGKGNVPPTSALDIDVQRGLDNFRQYFFHLWW